MGLWQALFGKKDSGRVTFHPDHVWKTPDQKWQGIRRDVAQREASGTSVILLVAHFTDVLEELSRIADDSEGGVPIRPVAASDLSGIAAQLLPQDPEIVVDLIVGERHLIPGPDADLDEFARSVPCRCRISRHISLEDPGISGFSNAGTMDILEKMGLPDDEAICSPMVDRAIRRFQQLLETRATGNRPAASAAEWLQLNVPSDSQPA